MLGDLWTMQVRWLDGWQGMAGWLDGCMGGHPYGSSFSHVTLWRLAIGSDCFSAPRFANKRHRLRCSSSRDCPSLHLSMPLLCFWLSHLRSLCSSLNHLVKQPSLFGPCSQDTSILQKATFPLYFSRLSDTRCLTAGGAINVLFYVDQLDMTLFASRVRELHVRRGIQSILLSELDS